MKNKVLAVMVGASLMASSFGLMFGDFSDLPPVKDCHDCHGWMI